MADVAAIEAAGLLDGIEEERVRQERIELVRFLLDDGCTMQELQDAARRGRLALVPVDRILGREQPIYSSVDIAERCGLPRELTVRLWRALGLAETEPDEVAFSEGDLDAAKLVAQFHAAGLGDEPLELISQVMGDGMSRLAETIREIAGQALLETGDSERTLGLRYAQATEQLVPMLTPMLGYVLAVHLREQIKGDIIDQAELAAGRFDEARDVTVCFADLVGFTKLGERVSPADLGAAGRELTRMAVEAARPPVRLVKMIGDAAFLVSPEPEPLVRAGIELVERTEGRAEWMPSVRVGVAGGRAIRHSGDWFGAPVNLASRVTDVARPASVLVTRDVRESTRDLFSWSYAGRRRFKGVRDEVPLYRARPLAVD